ncbi:phosphonopyruvate decarboxylase-like [Octopus vulgaris]|uniref:Phosphonopyruvate decarboxylase-like n=1 Tax=Octopus vulgaris TaxID=6645 RepID=A0AA36B9E6_OCTVU|nr:phosphonopyruvate decarboxylase-like [Octopus vulgaris]
MMTELVRDFLDPADFYKALHNIGIEYFCGVPDSLLKDFCAYIAETSPKDRHIITANEGSAVALAAGYHLATGKSSLVYLQNSGLGNIVNPLMSLASISVYSIPMLLLVGWRGEPGKRDEPQHLVQGHATPGLLDVLREFQWEVRATTWLQKHPPEFFKDGLRTWKHRLEECIDLNSNYVEK